MENFKPYPKASESETLDGAQKSVLKLSGDFDENHYLILDTWRQYVDWVWRVWHVSET